MTPVLLQGRVSATTLRLQPVHYYYAVHQETYSSRTGARRARLERVGRAVYLSLDAYGLATKHTTLLTPRSLAAARQIAQKWTRA